MPAAIGWVKPKSETRDAISVYLRNHTTKPRPSTPMRLLSFVHCFNWHKNCVCLRLLVLPSQYFPSHTSAPHLTSQPFSVYRIPYTVCRMSYTVCMHAYDAGGSQRRTGWTTSQPRCSKTASATRLSSAGAWTTAKNTSACCGRRRRSTLLSSKSRMRKGWPKSFAKTRKQPPKEYKKYKV